MARVFLVLAVALPLLGFVAAQQPLLGSGPVLFSAGPSVQQLHLSLDLAGTATDLASGRGVVLDVHANGPVTRALDQGKPREDAGTLMAQVQLLDPGSDAVRGAYATLLDYHAFANPQGGWTYTLATQGTGHDLLAFAVHGNLTGADGLQGRAVSLVLAYGDGHLRDAQADEPQVLEIDASGTSQEQRLE